MKENAINEEIKEEETAEEHDKNMRLYWLERKNEEVVHRIQWHNQGIRMKAIMNRDC